MSLKLHRQNAQSYLWENFQPPQGPQQWNTYKTTNGTGLEVALTQYKTYVLPTLLYGLEALVLGKEELKILGAHHRKIPCCM